MKRPPPRFRPLLARSERISGIAMKRPATSCNNRLERDSQSGGRGFDPPAVHQLRTPRVPWGKPGVSSLRVQPAGQKAPTALARVQASPRSPPSQVDDLYIVPVPLQILGNQATMAVLRSVLATQQAGAL